MKTAGIIGGIGPESTIEYYRLIIKTYRSMVTDGSYPFVIINSIDMKRMLDGIAGGRLDETVEYLSREIERLSTAGAEFVVLASNTPHIVYDELRRRSRVPLISIVEATCRAALAMGARRAGLFGTKFTTNGGFYQSVFEPAGLEIVVPSSPDQKYIHDKYMTELVNGIVLEDTRAELIRIAVDIKRKDGIDCLILGGTELPLILRDASGIGIPLLDTTAIHVSEIVRSIIDETR